MHLAAHRGDACDDRHYARRCVLAIFGQRLRKESRCLRALRNAATFRALSTRSRTEHMTNVSAISANFRKSAFAALAYALALAGTSLPAAAGPLSGTYTLTPAQVDTGFSVKVLGGGPVTGEFKTVSGKMILDQSRPEKSRVTVTVDLRSVQTGNDRVTGFLKSSAMFDVEKYPLATFQSTRVQITGSNTANVEGVLTMRGQKKRTSLSVTITDIKTNGRVGFEVSGGFLRSFYGMQAGMPIYADKVNLRIKGTGRRG